MFSIPGVSIEKGLFLAPMEDVTDLSFRLVCRELGADFVFTEFVNAEGLVRNSEKTHKKLEIADAERPVGIQIYGGNLESMISAAKIAEEHAPEVIDINAGCWVKNVVGHGAGAALIKDPNYLQQVVGEVVKAVKLPVSVKTRIGWDTDNINILDIAKRLEDVGVQYLTIHCRTRSQGHSGEPEWGWIEKIKNVVSIPVVLNGGIMIPEDAIRAFQETPADAVMIARGAIGNPWIFRQIKALMNGDSSEQIDEKTRILACLKHLKLAMQVKGDRRAVIEHRKFYTGYLKGMRRASYVRGNLMQWYEYSEIEEVLLQYAEQLMSGNEIVLKEKE